MRLRGIWSFLAVFWYFLPGATAFAQDLTVGAGDLWVSQGADGGYHLYIRKKPDIASVLLAETTRDPALRESNYAYRTNTWNPVNGNELRIIDEKVLPQVYSWSLISSTPEFVPALGHEVFHIYIPYIVYYGYPETRHGEVYVGDGTYFNIRAFQLPYGDYRSAFLDNPFVLTISQEPKEPPPPTRFMPETERAFEQLSRATGGKDYHAQDANNLVEVITEILKDNTQENLDVVICLDTTSSMKNYLTAMRMKLISALGSLWPRFPGIRLGMVVFRDYTDAYLTRVTPFTSDRTAFQRSLGNIQAAGGGDIPEAVHEGLYDAITKYTWRNGGIIILIGDAPPHPTPRGKITAEMVVDRAKEKKIAIHAITVPQ